MPLFCLNVSQTMHSAPQMPNTVFFRSSFSSIPFKSAWLPEGLLRDCVAEFTSVISIPIVAMDENVAYRLSCRRPKMCSINVIHGFVISPLWWKHSPCCAAAWHFTTSQEWRNKKKSWSFIQSLCCFSFIKSDIGVWAQFIPFFFFLWACRD